MRIRGTGSHHTPNPEVKGGQQSKIKPDARTSLVVLNISGFEIEMEVGFLLEDHKSLVEEHFEAINRRFHQLQQGVLDFTFPSNVSGM